MELISMKSFKNNDILYITPSHQFPTGYVMSLKKRTQLIKWAQQRKNDILLKMIMIQNLDISENLFQHYRI